MASVANTLTTTFASAVAEVSVDDTVVVSAVDNVVAVARATVVTCFHLKEVILLIQLSGKQEDFSLCLYSRRNTVRDYVNYEWAQQARV